MSHYDKYYELHKDQKSSTVSRHEMDLVQRMVASVIAEYTLATNKFPAFNSTHEGYGVLLEEVDELWDAIKANDLEHARREAIQVAAMAIRFLVDSEGFRKS